MPQIACQPKWVNMYLRSHPHAAATIRTGGAAKCVSVPPMEIFTKSSPSVAYFSRRLGFNA